MMGPNPPRRVEIPVSRDLYLRGMRFLHTSDWHLGRTFHGHSILQFQQEFLDWVIERARACEVDAVVIAGDVYDRSVPGHEAIEMLERALVDLLRICPVILISGNHDSPTRLGFGGPILRASGLHLGTRVATIANPAVITGRDGVPVAFYTLPYLEPDLVRRDLDAERSHRSVLTSAMDRVRDHAATLEPGTRTVAVAHAFVTGGSTSESERDLSIGGIGDVPSTVFSGVDYVALGHLHGAQNITHPDGTHVRYSGSPLAFSFSEEKQRKSVTLVDLSVDGPPELTVMDCPIPRGMASLEGTLHDLLNSPEFAYAEGHWVRITLTDVVRPEDPMRQLRGRFPHAITLDFTTGRGERDGERDTAARRAMTPVEITERFITYVTGREVVEDERVQVRDAVETAQREQVSA